MTRMDTPTVTIAPEVDDPRVINQAIIDRAAEVRQGDESVVVRVEYAGRGSDLVSVSASGLIEAV